MSCIWVGISLIGPTTPPIYLFLNFEIPSCKIEFDELSFCLVLTGFLQATQAAKIQFNLRKKFSLSDLDFQTGESSAYR